MAATAAETAAKIRSLVREIAQEQGTPVTPESDQKMDDLLGQLIIEAGDGFASIVEKLGG